MAEHFKSKWVEKGGWGKDAAFEQISLGWFIHFKGSWEALYFGDIRPRFDAGDTVKITFEKVR